MRKTTCDTCKWWEMETGKDESAGTCHYNPPTVIVVRSGFDASLQPRSVFPEVAATEFCALWTSWTSAKGGVEVKAEVEGGLAT